MLNQLDTAAMAASQVSGGGTVRDQIAMKVLNDAENQQENMIQQLIVNNQPVATTPKSMNSTFELIM